MRTQTVIFITLFLFGLSLSKIFHVERVPYGISGNGVTTRYWDCCKPSCAWRENLVDKTSKPVVSCAADGKTEVIASTKNSCDGGDAYMCSNQQPKVVNSSFAYGFVAASFTGGKDTNYCCACMLLTFQDSALRGKQMLVQVTNTGGDLGKNHFDIAIPGGGMGIFTKGCSSQWATSINDWGNQYGGVSSITECNKLSKDLQEGCRYRFHYMEGVSNPSVTFEQVKCPSELVEITQCKL